MFCTSCVSQSHNLSLKERPRYTHDRTAVQLSRCLFPLDSSTLNRYPTPTLLTVANWRMAGRNVHDLEFREAKQPQAGPSVPVGDLFRLNNRTIVSMGNLWIRFVVRHFTDNSTFATVTGASGFLGVEVAVAILQSGGDVVALDLRPSPPTVEWGEPPA